MEGKDWCALELNQATRPQYNVQALNCEIPVTFLFGTSSKNGCNMQPWKLRIYRML